MEKYIKKIEAEIEKAKRREIVRYREGLYQMAKEDYVIQTGLMLALDILLNKK